MVKFRPVAREIDYYDWVAAYEEELARVARELLANDTVARRCRLISFRSRSNGRWRKPRHLRYVDLLVVDSDHAYVVKDGEIKPRRKRGDHSQPDQLAAEILENLPEDERTADALLQRVLAIAALGARRD